MPEIPELDIKPQPRMSPRRLFEFTWTGIRYRMFRALMTVLVIAVAIAFVVNILLDTINAQIVRQVAGDELARLKLAPRWVSRVSLPATHEGILVEFVQSEPGSRVFREAAHFGRLTGQEAKQLHTIGGQALAVLDFLRNLDYKERRTLAEPDVDLGSVDTIAVDPGRHAFFSELRRFRTIRLPFDRVEFEDFLDHWPGAANLLDRIVQGRNRAVASLRPEYRDRSALDALLDADGAFGERLRAAGFMLPPDLASPIAAEAALESLSLRIQAALADSKVRQVLAAALDRQPADVAPALIWRLVRNDGRAEWFRGVYREHHSSEIDWTIADLQTIAARNLYETRLEAAERATLEAESGAGLFGLSAKLSVLLVVSLMVCGVGITNAMLMSVTERYREIATLKCLGALDGSILWIFIMEACIQGVVGGAVGSLLGSCFVFFRSGLRYGELYLRNLPLGDMAVIFIVTIILGSILAGLASVFPSWKAARLAPLEAMRIE